MSISGGSNTRWWWHRFPGAPAIAADAVIYGEISTPVVAVVPLVTLYGRGAGGNSVIERNQHLYTVIDHGSDKIIK